MVDARGAASRSPALRWMSHEVEEALAAGVIRHVRTADALAAYALIQTADARGMRNTFQANLQTSVASHFGRRNSFHGASPGSDASTA